MLKWFDLWNEVNWKLARHAIKVYKNPFKEVRFSNLKTGHLSDQRFGCPWMKMVANQKYPWMRMAANQTMKWLQAATSYL